jgi:hypothetical protein
MRTVIQDALFSLPGRAAHCVRLSCIVEGQTGQHTRPQDVLAVCRDLASEGEIEMGHDQGIFTLCWVNENQRHTDGGSESV